MTRNWSAATERHQEVRSENACFLKLTFVGIVLLCNTAFSVDDSVMFRFMIYNVPHIVWFWLCLSTEHSAWAQSTKNAIFSCYNALFLNLIYLFVTISMYFTAIFLKFSYIRKQRKQNFTESTYFLGDIFTWTHILQPGHPNILGMTSLA